MNIYTLSAFQYKTLSVSAEHAAPVMLQELNPVGSFDERTAQANNLAAMRDLINLGLMMDVSDSQKVAIDTFREQYGYGLKFFIVTENGFSMFNKKNMVVN